jgi:hypothetical protein
MSEDLPCSDIYVSSDQSNLGVKSGGKWKHHNALYVECSVCLFYMPFHSEGPGCSSSCLPLQHSLGSTVALNIYLFGFCKIVRVPLNLAF